jgi:hypothetical protein
MLSPLAHTVTTDAKSMTTVAMLKQTASPWLWVRTSAVSNPMRLTRVIYRKLFHVVRSLVMRYVCMIHVCTVMYNTCVAHL